MMTRRLGTIVAVMAVALWTATTAALGQTLQERVDALEKKVDEQQKSIAATLGLDIHGMVATDYLYNFNNPDSRENQFRVIDTDANSFTVNDGFLSIAHTRKEDNLGFVIDMDFGKTGVALGATDDATPRLREAYITYKVPFGPGINLKAGKFVTLLGYEVLKTWSSFNPNITNSFLFGYAIPFTHTGLLADVPLGDMFTLDIGVVNGWDNSTDNNDGKTLLAGVGFNPTDALSFYLSGTYGPEQSTHELVDSNGNPVLDASGNPFVVHAGSSKRGVGTLVTTYKATKELSFVVDADYGNESDLVPNSTGTGLTSALWYGAAGYAIYNLTDKISLNLRAETMVDSDGTRTGVSQTAWELTPTVGYQITDGLLWRGEYRHDESNKQYFMSGDHYARGQDTIETELIYGF